MGSILEPRVGWLQIAIMTAGLLVVYEVGYRIARRRREETRDAKKSQVDVAVAALLALLGLLLAFSFQIGAERFDKRKALVLDESNAITTTYLRATLVQAPYSQRIQALLREYVQVRAKVTSAAELERALAESGRLHGELWANATEVAHASPDSPVAALFIDSLNKMIDLHEARVTVALYQRIPPAIFVSLYFVALLSLGIVGIRAGLDRVRGLAAAALLVASVMCVMALIASLDQPMSRLFGISKHAIEDTQRILNSAAPGTTAVAIRGDSWKPSEAHHSYANTR
jgi:hypothetical protein